MPQDLPDWESDARKELEPFARVRLIALDVDGTLLEDADAGIYNTINTLGRSLRYAYQVRLTLATGRTLRTVRPLTRQLPFLGPAPLILYNGSLIVRNGKFDTLRQHKIPSDSLDQVVEICRSYPVNTLAYFSSQELGLIGQSEHVVGWANGPQRPKTESNGMKIRWLESDASVAEEPTAIVIDMCGGASSSRIIQGQLDSVRGITSTKGAEKRFIEIRPASSDKGTALRYVASLLKVARDEVLALGDSENDVEMLEWAGIGVAVSNGARAAIEGSRYVSRYGAARSAVQVLRLVKNACRYLRERKTQTVMTRYQ